MFTSIRLIALTLAGIALFALAAPAAALLPPPTEQEEAQAAETAAKNAWTEKLGLYQLCRAMDRTAMAYRSRLKAAGREVREAVPTPPCTDPGAYISPIAAAQSKPLEAASAHSPADNATSPPSTRVPDAQNVGRSGK